MRYNQFFLSLLLSLLAVCVRGANLMHTPEFYSRWEGLDN